ncbi:hypothetical protein BH11ARM2_BH11ARM2_01250 [soil metagenome]
MANAANTDSFILDWHLVALPVLQEKSPKDPLSIFKKWVAEMLILSPIPPLLHGDSEGETLQPEVDLSNFAQWFTGLLRRSPAAYADIDRYLRGIMPDLKDIQNPDIGRDFHRLTVNFATGKATFSVPFSGLSDGEKCFVICATVIAANRAYGPLVCFWDEPDNFIGISEVGHLVLALRRSVGAGGQFIATSHNPEAIRAFSDENTFLVYRNSHLEPTLLRKVSDLDIHGDLVSALTRGDAEP